MSKGLNCIYANPETGLCLIQARHGPHRLVASCLPFLTKIQSEKVVPRLVYTGATIRNCYRRMVKFQKSELERVLSRLEAEAGGSASEVLKTKETLSRQMLSLQQMKHRD